MNKKLIIILVAVLLIVVGLSGCFEPNLDNEETYPENGDIRLLSTEFVGGKYNASILEEEIYDYEYYKAGLDDDGWIPLHRISYTKEGREYKGNFIPQMREALDWIRTNTSENCTILCWWDYGCMVEGYANRKAITTFASLSLKYTIPGLKNKSREYIDNYVKELGGWVSNETIGDIAKILTTINISSDETVKIIEKYNISYILTHHFDKHISWFIFDAADKNPDEYIIKYGSDEPTDKGNETLIFQIWDYEQDIQGLKMVFEHYPYGYYYNVEKIPHYNYGTKIFEVGI